MGTMDLNAESLAQQIYTQIMNTSLQQDQQLGSAIGQLRLCIGGEQSEHYHPEGGVTRVRVTSGIRKAHQCPANALPVGCLMLWATPQAFRACTASAGH